MINLLIDGLIALVKAIDGLFPDKRATPTDPYSVVEVAQPSGAGGHPPASAAGTGGHPVRSTSELLTHAHDVIVDVFELDRNGGYGPCFMLVRELRDRAASFAAHGD